MDFDVYGTMQCNLQCTYCYNNGNEVTNAHPLFGYEPLDPKVLSDFMLPQTSVHSIINFMGGEPFMATDWMEDVATRMKGRRIMVTTNGTLLEERLANRPELRDMIQMLQISMDGPRAVHDQVRGLGNFDRTLRNLRWLIDVAKWKGLYWFRTTVGPQMDMEECIRGLHEETQVNDFCVQWENGCDLHRFDEAKRFEELIRLWNWWAETPGVNINGFNNLYYTMLGERELPPARCGSCEAGWRYAQIFQDGNVYSCAERLLDRRAHMGDIRHGIQRMHLIGDEEATRKCTDCSAFWACGVRCMNFTPEPYCRVIREFCQWVKASDMKAVNANKADWETFRHWENMF